MFHPPTSRRIRTLIRGLLALLCLFAIPKLVMSEGEPLTDQDIISSKRPKRIPQGHGYGQSLSLPFYRENNDCAVAKVDIWLLHGWVTHAVSPPDAGWRTRSGAKRTTMIFGGKDCLIRVRIEPVPAGTSIFE